MWNLATNTTCLKRFLTNMASWLLSILISFVSSQMLSPYQSGDFSGGFLSLSISPHAVFINQSSGVVRVLFTSIIVILMFYDVSLIQMFQLRIDF